MVNVHESQAPVDGRSARRQRNIDSVLDVVIEMFTEGEFFPSIEVVAQRSGLSVRSIYRYFADPVALSDAAIRRHRELSEPLAHLSAIGQGPLAKRIDDFVVMRLQLHEAVAPAYQATVHNASRFPRLQHELARTRNDMRIQLELQFAPELRNLKGNERESVIAAADILTQLDAIQMLRRHRRLSVAKTADALKFGLCCLLGGDE